MKPTRYYLSFFIISTFESSRGKLKGELKKTIHNRQTSAKAIVQHVVHNFQNIIFAQKKIRILTVLLPMVLLSFYASTLTSCGGENTDDDNVGTLTVTNK